MILRFKILKKRIKNSFRLNHLIFVAVFQINKIRNRRVIPALMPMLLLFGVAMGQDSLTAQRPGAHADSTIVKREIDPRPRPPVFLRDTTNILRKLSKETIRKRTRLVIAGNVVGYGGAMVALNAAWYANYPRSKLKSFDDSREWLQADKVGHMYSAYVESLGSMELWRWTGIERKKRIWLGGMSGAVYQTVIEVLDGYSAEWGWSWGDFAANILGSGSLVAQELAWNEQRIRFKLSVRRKGSSSDPVLARRANELFGTSGAERFLKDYNAHTYWASVNMRSFLPKSKWPAWLNLAVGYGAEGMYGGFSNSWNDKNNGIAYDYSNIPRYRQWFLSPDIDLTRIPTRKKGVKFLFTVLNIFKIPSPTLELSRGKFRGHWLFL